jgi:hypothetical protein
MRLHLKNACETSRCLIVDGWSNDKSDSVIVVIVVAVSLIIDDHVMQDNASTYDQSESVLRVRPAMMTSMLNLFLVGRKHTPHLSLMLLDTLRRIDASFVEEQTHLS